MILRSDPIADCTDHYWLSKNEGDVIFGRRDRLGDPFPQ
jgi:hypothetical protein